MIMPLFALMSGLAVLGNYYAGLSSLVDIHNYNEINKMCRRGV